MSRIALDGKTAVVIGGTSGIGRTMAIGLAAAGANVVATGRRVELIDSVATEIEAQGVRTLRQPADVERPRVAAGAARRRRLRHRPGATS